MWLWLKLNGHFALALSTKNRFEIHRDDGMQMYDKKVKKMDFQYVHWKVLCAF